MEMAREKGKLNGCYIHGDTGSGIQASGKKNFEDHGQLPGRDAPAHLIEFRGAKALNTSYSKNNRIITRDEAARLREVGWQVADLHVHTFFSYDVVPTREVDPLMLYEKAVKSGMTFISFTDHDTMDAYDRIGWTRERLVTGVEVKILDRIKVGHTVHINVYTLNRQQFQEIENIAKKAQDIEMLVEYLRAENLPFILNHPFWHEPGEKLSAASVAEISEMFPVLEYNLGRIRKLNQLVLQLAASRNKGVAAGTDSHTGDIGRIFTVAPGNDFREFFAAIEQGNACMVTEDLTYHRIKNEIGKRLEMLLDSREWVMAREGLKMETGNALADAVIEILSGGKEGARAFGREAIKFLATMFSRTGLPARIYLRKQTLLASRLEEELNLAA
ncbi:MAG: PHP domain-containing protein [Candidatus Saccharicenans sp.]|nr:PHP domain-containing protein [Candidatus Saccharicenans sp.]